MKSRNRPPLNLTDPEPQPVDNGTSPETDTSSDSAVVEPIFTTPSKADADPELSLSIERPMSERRRRRLLEEQRQADDLVRRTQTRAIEPIPEPHSPSAADIAVTVPMADDFATPPAPYEAPQVPTASKIHTTTAPTGRLAYPLAAAASVLWIGGVAAWAAYELGSGGAALDPLRLALYALIALAPAGLAVLLAHTVRQGAGLANETRRARDLAEALVAPTALAAQQTGQVLLTLRSDIDQAALAAERARNDMGLLRQALVEETARLTEAAEIAGRAARHLVQTLGQEREEMQTLGTRLDTQSAGVLEAVERQSRMIVDASDLAQTQLREAEAALAARAADLAAAAGEAQDAAKLASEDLARQTLRLENAGTGVAEQIQSVEEGLGQQRAALVTAVYALRTDQEDFSAQVESQRAQLSEQLSAARSATGELGATSAQTAETLRDLVEAATDQFRALVDMSQREADGFDAATKLALDRFEALSAEARDALMEETRRALAALQATADQSRAAASEAVGQAQIRTDRLGETLFDAAQKADQAADARIEGARKIVRETTSLLEDAGERSVERLEATMERMTQALGQVDAAISDLDQRASRLPQEAQKRADAVRQTVESGLASLAAASRKAAEDTEALEAGFQERVRRNYDMLTEAVRLMGVVSGDAPGTRRRETILDALPPLPTENRERPSPPRPAQTSSSQPAAVRRDEPADFGLRGRLRLEPTESEPRPAPPTPQRQSVDWKTLSDDANTEETLDLDDIVPPVDSARQGQRVIEAIQRMGVDPNALLPRSRVEEAAGALAKREPDRARQIVRRVAPAAVRSVSRRVMSDRDLKVDCEGFVRDFARRMAEHGRTGDGAAALATLATDEGRAFMLLDAAIGDLS